MVNDSAPLFLLNLYAKFDSGYFVSSEQSASTTLLNKIGECVRKI